MIIATILCFLIFGLLALSGYKIFKLRGNTTTSSNKGKLWIEVFIYLTWFVATVYNSFVPTVLLKESLTFIFIPLTVIQVIHYYFVRIREQRVRTATKLMEN